VHHETVRAHLVEAVARARAGETPAEVLARLAMEKPAAVELICVSDESGRLVGALSIARLFSLEAGTTIGDAMDRAFPRIGVGDDQETAASLALHHGVDALPVVD